MIRKAKPSEIGTLLTITKACAAKMASEGIFQWDEAYPNVAAFQKDEKRGELYALFAEETIIGCITISTFKDEEYNTVDWLTKDGLQYYIHRLAVHPDFQHQGQAKKLMDFAESFAKQQGAVSVRLDTFSQNIRNQRFYEARGYQKLGDVYFPRQAEYPFHCYELVL
ncbi:GNAT family N-acetyltransferase [Marinirhabdus gelatinilytica]|uniref:Acetyltransferase (GNAT) family protein n=1 Tax=Marinirhabdus gelatinilytica TaxID=1703343 RepID=A0A370QJ71_9FLAO|nr:GNAT family N-acetyltransferase [Marinirhabdus gelatinilytica]RDK88417.1 acetyltransferase (GNAT) family protein [Marinirhabdus gelatinilytica]